MLSINKKNIYVPFREDELKQRSKIFYEIKNYYEKNYFNVITLDSGEDNFNIGASKNMAFNYEDEVICLINADTLIQSYSLNNAIKNCIKYKSIIKPFTRYFLVDDINLYINSFLNENIINNFDYHSVQHYHPGSAWIIYNKNIKIFDEKILDPRINNIEYLIRSSIESKTIFIESDAYSVNHAKFSRKNSNIDLEKILDAIPDHFLSIYKNNDSEENKINKKEIKKILRI